ncbi:MAG TPA: hypothetical protein VK072_09375 [Candidatus Avamphibacillus sp.]|nr:hypothetical protein [Candidatus Avamphibacillus sp.]
MRKRFNIILLLTGIVMLMASCGASSNPTQEGVPIEEGSYAEEAYRVVKENNKAMNEEDVDAFAATYVEDMRENAREQMNEVIQRTDFKHELSSPKVMEESEDGVIISVVQTTEDLTGENDELEEMMEHELIRVNGEFKIRFSRPAK